MQHDIITVNLYCVGNHQPTCTHVGQNLKLRDILMGQTNNFVDSYIILIKLVEIILAYFYGLKVYRKSS